ncbi:hypothetical protein [Bacillus sp. ISL-37]|nr:hypothetical protein [Bacillus sp. ISL-37]
MLLRRRHNETFVEQPQETKQKPKQKSEAKPKKSAAKTSGK